MERDLFGLPVLPPSGGPGRPEHRWCLETSNRVLLAFARGLSQAEAAAVIGIDAKTLRKHYSRECGMRKTAALRLEQRQLERLNAEAEKGNVGAEKALANRIEQLRLRDAGKRFTAPDRRKAEPVLGKKAERKLRAKKPTGSWEDLLGAKTEGVAQAH
jgi:hypothetical protein